MGKTVLVALILFVVGVGTGASWEWSQPKPFQVESDQEKTVLGQMQVVWPTPTPDTCSFTMAAVGDVMLGRSVQEQMEKRNDWKWPMVSVAGKLATADVTLGNLEAALVSGCYQKENRYVLCARPEAVASLTVAGFDVLSMANNHTLNWGYDGYEESMAILREVGVESIDNERVVYLERCGVKIGFLGFDDVSRRLDLDLAETLTASVAAQSEITVGLIHWGVEYVDQPTERQREVAEALVSAGMDVIVGHHPHWVQPAERMDQGLVFWSLGNFVFDQMWSEATRQGVVAEVRFKIQDSRITAIEYDLLPVRIYDYGQPRLE